MFRTFGFDDARPLPPPQRYGAPPPGMLPPILHPFLERRAGMPMFPPPGLGYPPHLADVLRRGDSKPPSVLGRLARGLSNFGLGGRPPSSSQRNLPSRSGVRCSIPGYDVIKRMQRGGMSEAVNLVKSRTSGKLYVEKRVRTDGGNEKYARAEISALGRLGRESRHINFLVQYAFSHHSLTFILEYCEGGSLRDKMTAYAMSKRTFSSDYLWHILVSIARGLAYMHFGILDAWDPRPVSSSWNTTCHLDLKLDNIFITSSDQRGGFPRVVIGDFGCVVTMQDIISGRASSKHQDAGNQGWFPPERLAKVVGSRRTRLGPESDIWQAGAVIQCLAQFLPEPDRGRLNSEYPVGSRYSGMLNAMVEELCHKDWRRRPSALKVVRAIERMMS